LRFRTRPASAATFRGMPTFESKTQRALQNCPSRKPRKRPALPLQRAPRNLLGNLVTPASLRAATTHRGDPRWPGLKRSMQCCEAMFDEETFGISWMRGAPQSGFSGLIFRISFGSLWILVGAQVGRGGLSMSRTGGIPCGARQITVSGFTMQRAERHSAHAPQNQAHNIRSNLLFTERCSTPS
jgi:hypothetical protein